MARILSKCLACGQVSEWNYNGDTEPACPECGYNDSTTENCECNKELNDIGTPECVECSGYGWIK